MDVKEKIMKLERELFFLEMKDKWDSVDFEESERLREEIRKLKQECPENQ